MANKTNAFKKEVKGLCALHGRQTDWLVEQMGISSRQYWHKKLNAQSFTHEEQNKIRDLIVNGLPKEKGSVNTKKHGHTK